MTKESHAYNALQKREDSMTKVIQSFQGSDLQPLNARLLRGEVDPWETLPLNNPLSTGLGNHSFAKMVFSHRDLTTFPQKVVFYLFAKGEA